MSSAFDLTIDGTSRPEETDLEADLLRNDFDADFVRVTEDRAAVSFWDRKWGVDGLRAFAEYLSRRYPDATIRLEETWDGRDEDEPGGIGYVWQAGTLHRTGVIGWTWQDVR